MKRPFVLVVVFILLIANVANGQDKTPVMPTAAEQQEVQALAERFVEQLLQTQDITPLMSEFFVSGFSSCLRQQLIDGMDPSDRSKMQLTSEELLRGYAAFINITYFATVAHLYDEGRGLSKYDSLESAFPPRIQKNLDTLGGPYRAPFFDEDIIKSRKKYLDELARTEQIIEETRAYLIKKKITESPFFLKKYNESTETESGAYKIETNVSDEVILCSPKGTLGFGVGTPLWLWLGIIKEDGKLKILFAGYPD